jgi:hypothetical protein
MSNEETLSRKELRTLRAAAIAGMLFGVLLITSQGKYPLTSGKH